MRLKDLSTRTYRALLQELAIDQAISPLFALLWSHAYYSMAPKSATTPPNATTPICIDRELAAPVYWTTPVGLEPDPEPVAYGTVLFLADHGTLPVGLPVGQVDVALAVEVDETTLPGALDDGDGVADEDEDEDENCAAQAWVERPCNMCQSVIGRRG
jgi:hypothetical protein